MLWKEACNLAPDNDDYRIGYIKTLADARMDTLALQEARQRVAEKPSGSPSDALFMSIHAVENQSGFWQTSAR